MTHTPIRVLSQPGIKRDGTRFEGGGYVDGEWVRFQRGLPRKIAGYLSVTRDLPQLVYGISSFSSNNLQYFHLGSESQLAQRLINNVGSVIGSFDRTPGGLVPSADNLWQFDFIFDVNLNDTALVAHAAPNMDLSSQTDTDIFEGVVTDPTVLTTSAQGQVSGGIVVVGNYLVAFGNGGYVQWSDPNNLSGVAGAGNFTQQKIVAGRRVRGGGRPTALLWSLDSLLLMSFTGDPTTGVPTWSFNTLTDSTSILSSRSVIEYDGIFYWLGVDRPLLYNGAVLDVPNRFNVNFFYDNLNFAQRQKVFAYKVPRFGEIWWCFPKGDSTECNHAIILNVREQTWYDTPLPNGGRSDGLYAQVYFRPFMTGIVQGVDGYDLWQHETGVNQIRLGDVQPIRSYFETAEISMMTSGDSPQNKSISLSFLEPDFVQAGDLEVKVTGRANARAPYDASAAQVITDVATNTDEQVVRFKELRRLMSFRFESNTVDGDYQMGEVLAHIAPDQGRLTS